MAGKDDAPEEGRSGPDSRNRGHRWECPVCDLSRVNRLSEEGRNALRALRTHVYLADGNGHGETGTFPRGIAEEELEEFVKPHGERE